MIIWCLVCRSPDISLSKWLDYWGSFEVAIFLLHSQQWWWRRGICLSKILRCGLSSLYLPTFDLVLEHTQQNAELLTSITLCSLRNWPIMICSKCFGSFSPRLFKKTRVGKAVYRPDNNKVGEKLFLMTLLISGLKRKQHDWITTYYIDLGQIQLHLLWIDGRLIC